MATVAKRGNSYKITVSSGYDVNGKQIRHHLTWMPEPGMTPKQIEKELERQKVLFEEECKNGGGAADGRVKFESFARQWFKEYAQTKLKATTIKGYHDCERRSYAAIGHLRMDKITTRAIQKFILNLGEDGVNMQNGKGMSPKSIKNYLSFISTIFNYAVKQGVVKTNPCRGVSLPTIPQVERDCYTLEEAQQFLELLENEPMEWRVLFTLATYGGFRRGELFGLEWQDIDFDTGVVTIQRTSLYIKEKGVFTDTPKTKNSIRYLKLPDYVMDLLKRYKAEQAERQLQLGNQWVNTGRLLAGWNGAPMNPSSARNWVQRFCKRTGMRKMNVHSFRHLNASLLITSGTDVKTVSAALGHKQVSTTLNIYGHTFAAVQAKAADAIADKLALKKEAQ